MSLTIDLKFEFTQIEVKVLFEALKMRNAQITKWKDDLTQLSEKVSVNDDELRGQIHQNIDRFTTMIVHGEELITIIETKIGMKTLPAPSGR